MTKVTVSISVDIEVADPEEFEKQLPHRMDSVLSAIRTKMPTGGVEVSCEYENKEVEETEVASEEESTESESTEETSTETESEKDSTEKEPDSE